MTNPVTHPGTAPRKRRSARSLHRGGSVPLASKNASQTRALGKSSLWALRALLASTLTLTFAPAVVAEEPRFPGLEALMSEDEFRRTGLDQLAPEQRAALNRWLAQRARFKLEEEDVKKAGRTAKAESLDPQESTSNDKDLDRNNDKKQDKKKSKRLIAKRLTRAERSAVKPIRTRIVGPFRGWTGTTLFALENGEYWKQRQSGRYYYKAESPEVELFKNRLGFWEIRILATGKTVKVSRYDP